MTRGLEILDEHGDADASALNPATMPRLVSHAEKAKRRALTDLERRYLLAELTIAYLDTAKREPIPRGPARVLRVHFDRLRDELDRARELLSFLERQGLAQTILDVLGSERAERGEVHGAREDLADAAILIRQFRAADVAIEHVDRIDRTLERYAKRGKGRPAGSKASTLEGALARICGNLGVSDAVARRMMEAAIDSGSIQKARKRAGKQARK